MEIFNSKKSKAAAQKQKRVTFVTKIVTKSKKMSELSQLCVLLQKNKQAQSLPFLKGKM